MINKRFIKTPESLYIKMKKTLLNKQEVKDFKLKSNESLKKQLVYFNVLKQEGLIKHWLSFHQFKNIITDWACIF